MEDIYCDLDNYEHVNDAEKLEQENAELRSKIKAITHELANLREDYNKLEIEHKKLEANYSSLLKTAKTEIERKTQLISRLNTEKDQLVLRYLSTNRHLPCKQNVNTNPTLIDEKQNKKNHENIPAESSVQPKEQPADQDNKLKDTTERSNKSATETTEHSSKNATEPTEHSSKNATEVGKSTDKKKMKDERITKRGKSMLETRSARMSLSSLSSEDDATVAFSDKNVQRKAIPSSHMKNSYGDSKGKYDNVNRKERRSQSPRESHDYRSRYDYRDRYSQRYRYREVSPKSKRSYNYEIREERHRKSRRDGKVISESPPNLRKQRYKSWDRYHRDHHYTSKDYQINNEDSECDVGSSSHNKIHEENSDARNRKRQLKEEDHDDRPVMKRRKDDEVGSETILHGEVEKSVDLPFKISDVLLSPDEESFDVPVKDCTIGQVSEVKLVDPRLSSEKYVQITDICNKTSLNTVFGRDIELKALHYARSENVHRIPSPLKSTYEFSDVFVKQVYENIDTQISNTSIARGEIIECDEVISMEVKNDSCFKNRIQQEKIQCTDNKTELEADCFVSCNEMLSRQIVEDDLELSEDTCDNIDCNSKKRKLVSGKNNTHKKLQDKDRQRKYMASKENKDELPKCSNKNDIISNIHNKESKRVENIDTGVDSNRQENKIPECVNENSITDNEVHTKKKDKESDKTKYKKKSKEKEYKASKHEKSKAHKGFVENLGNVNKKNEENTNSILSLDLAESEIPDHLIVNDITDNINDTRENSEENKKKKSNNKDKNKKCDKTPPIKTKIPKQSNLNNIVDNDDHLIELGEETKNSDVVTKYEENITAKPLDKNNIIENVQVTKKNDVENGNTLEVLVNETEEIPILLNYTNIIDNLESTKKKDLTKEIDDSDMASKHEENKIRKLLKETNTTDCVNHTKKRDSEIDSSDMASKYKEIEISNPLNESLTNKVHDTKEKGEESENSDAVSKQDIKISKPLNEGRIINKVDDTKEKGEVSENSDVVSKQEIKISNPLNEGRIINKVDDTKEKGEASKNSDVVSKQEIKISNPLNEGRIINKVDDTKEKGEASENSDVVSNHKESEISKLLSVSLIKNNTDNTKEKDKEIDNSGAALKHKESKLPELVNERHIIAKVSQTKEKTEKSNSSDIVLEPKENKIFTLLCKSHIIDNVDQTKEKTDKSENSDTALLYNKRRTPLHTYKNKKLKDFENKTKIATVQIEDDLITLEDLGTEVRNSDSDLLQPKCSTANKVPNQNFAIDSRTNLNVLISNECIDSKYTETKAIEFGTSTPVPEPLKPLHKEPEPDVRIFVRRNRKKKQITGNSS